MTESDASPPASAPEVRKARGVSAVWLIPLVAVALGAWLVWTTIQNRGPTITLTFPTAAGITAGKTQIKLRDVVVGTISAVRLAPDNETVVVTAAMVPEAESYLRTETRFWIVQPELGFEGVTGLSTLLSGPFIAVEPGSGEETRTFEGFPRRPPLPRDAPGRRFVLDAQQLGALKVGSPVFFRQVRIGEVTGFQIDARPELRDGELVCEEPAVATAAPFTVEIFVSDPFDTLVLDNSRFFNASGIALNLTGRRVRVELLSIGALLSGGVALETRTQASDVPMAQDCTRYTLFADQEAANEQPQDRNRIPTVMYFEDSLAGLEVGAPVTFRGITVGEVVAIDLEVDLDNAELSLPVRADLFDMVIELHGGGVGALSATERAAMLLERGMRARLASTNIITGALEVQLDFVSNAPSAELVTEDGIAVIPTVPSTLAQLEASVQGVLTNLQSLPLDVIGEDLSSLIETAQALLASPDLPEALRALRATAVSVQRLAERVERDSEPLMRDARSTLESASGAFATAEGVVAGAGRATFEAEALMAELRATARAIRGLVEFLERNPEALIQGRRGSR